MKFGYQFILKIPVHQGQEKFSEKIPTPGENSERNPRPGSPDLARGGGVATRIEQCLRFLWLDNQIIPKNKGVRVDFII